MMGKKSEGEDLQSCGHFLLRTARKKYKCSQRNYCTRG